MVRKRGGRAQRRSSLQRKAIPYIWGMVGLVIVAVILLIIFGNRLNGHETNREGIASTAKTLGSENAAVVITEYSNFGCSACKEFATTTEPQIVEQYVKTGKVRLEFKHYAFGAQDNWVAADAAECAAEQGKFWEYHDRLFARQGASGAFTKASLKRYAVDLGLESGSFDACLDSSQYRDRVNADVADGEKLGVNSTPTLFINQRKFIGAQPFAILKNVIDAELKAKGIQ
jgi:protein-disulfide isomerase